MSTGESFCVTLGDIQRASANLAGVTIRTPVLPAERLSEDIGARVFYKAENTQRAGSFKLRGAYNKIASLSLEERQKGVIAHSAGNHAQGVALAAKLWHVPATVVMPRFAPLAKVKATQRLGAEVILHGDSFDDAGSYARHLQQERGTTYVHAFNDPLTIAGQGTVGVELVEDLRDVETVVVPIGGGGLIAGMAVALRALHARVRIVGVQAAGCPAVPLSLQAGEPITVTSAATISDGIAVKRPGDLTLPIINQLVDDVVTVDDEMTARAIFHVLQHSRLVVEGAGAVGLAALLSGAIQVRPGGTVAVVLSGGNIDANFLVRIIEQVLVKYGRYLLVRTSVADRPGNLAPLLQHAAECGANVIDIQHRRAAWQLPLDKVGIEMILEVRDEQHGQSVIDHLTQSGYHVERFGQRVWPV